MYIPFDSPDQVLAALGAAAPPDCLWCLCVADRHAEELPQLLGRLRARDMRAVGGLFPGLITAAVRHDSGIVAFALPAGSHVADAAIGADGVHWRRPLPALEAASWCSATVLVDCIAPSISALLEELFDHCGERLSYVGAGAGYRDLRPAPAIFTEAGLAPESALVVLTAEQTAVAVRHGWRRIEGPYVASRTRGNVIQELNWEPAGSFYRNRVTAQDERYRGRPVFPDLNARYPLSIGKQGGEDVIRDPIRITDDDEIVVLSDVTENAVMYLVTASAESLVEAAGEAVLSCGDGFEASRCFVSDCYSRALLLGDDFERELRVVSEAADRGVPVEGVLALGEIASDGRQKLELFNKTFAIAVVHEAS